MDSYSDAETIRAKELVQKGRGPEGEGMRGVISYR